MKKVLALVALRLTVAVSVVAQGSNASTTRAVVKTPDCRTAGVGFASVLERAGCGARGRPVPLGKGVPALLERRQADPGRSDEVPADEDQDLEPSATAS